MKENSKDQKDKKKNHGSMGMRGVSRPMAEKKVKQHSHNHHSEGKQHKQDHEEGHGMMGEEQRMQMLHMHYMQTLWIYWMLIILGIWLVLSPLTFSYAKGVVEPSGGRDVWLSMSQRISFMKWSDIISGLGLIFFGWRSLTPNRPVSLWIACFIGIWLNVAPVLFWAPNAVAYLNDTLVGVLVIALTILIPGMPNMIMYMKMGSQVPPRLELQPFQLAPALDHDCTGICRMVGFPLSGSLSAGVY